jgi:predicted HicB family RNase H-like nuclease
MAKDKKPPPAESRDRFDLRIEPSLRRRIERQAERLGINASAYLRLAVTLKLEADEASEPKKK